MSTFHSPTRQLFSVPYDFILYMTDKPSSPEGLEKLYQTCKFFYARNQILVHPKIQCNRAVIINGNEIVTNAKFWPSMYFLIYGKFVPEKFYRFSPTTLSVYFCNLSLQEFEILVAENTTIKYTSFNTTITNGPIVVEVDGILDKLPNVTHFTFWDYEYIYSLEIPQKLNALQRKIKFKHCDFQLFSNISESYVPELWGNFMLQNGNFDSCYDFYFLSDYAESQFMEALKNQHRFLVTKPDNYVNVKVLDVSCQ